LDLAFLLLSLSKLNLSDFLIEKICKADEKINSDTSQKSKIKDKKSKLHIKIQKYAAKR